VSVGNRVRSDNQLSGRAFSSFVAFCDGNDGNPARSCAMRGSTTRVNDRERPLVSPLSLVSFLSLSRASIFGWTLRYLH
jgi:hypothetical protein